MANIKNPKRKIMLIPEVKIITTHEKTTRRVWPISGCIINSNEITNIKTIDNKYSTKRLELLLLQRIVANITIKNGFNNSIGWNLGKNNKSIHLFDPFTSIPIIGTKNNKIREIKNKKIEYLNSCPLLRVEKITIIKTPIKI